MLTPFDKQRRLQKNKDFLELVGDNIDEICDRIVTVDETWVRQYDSESKQESMQWTKKGERPPKKFKVQKSASKLMATIFWDSEGVLLIDYLPKGTTMNGQYYANLLAQAREAVVQKRRGKLSRGVLFLQDNASVHTARVSRQALKDTGFSEIDRPPYSPDLAPSDYFLFSNLKKELRGRRFVDDNQMKMAVESHFDCKEKEYFLGGLKALYTRSYASGVVSRVSIKSTPRCHSRTRRATLGHARGSVPRVSVVTDVPNLPRASPRGRVPLHEHPSRRAGAPRVVVSSDRVWPTNCMRFASSAFVINFTISFIEVASGVFVLAYIGDARADEEAARGAVRERGRGINRRTVIKPVFH
ncbi:Histone-lysine N-methyltransferase SETMAR [Eumeta japonica]|uniref:Histone-lysine N-methyltransferase SETMAR n=1 Tax=Eumeta variegata TaxID=151549 RepID=A0A4C1W6V2_EUMVA|nr:Histone-lysine N-methyltransferase SETMAR [Eumeta japonica]